MKDIGCVNNPMVTKVFTCFNMVSHIIRSILRCSIQASLFGGPCFTIMHFRVIHTDVRAFIFYILRSNGSVLVHRCGRGARQLQEVTDSER